MRASPNSSGCQVLTCRNPVMSRIGELRGKYIRCAIMCPHCCCCDRRVEKELCLNPKF